MRSNHGLLPRPPAENRIKLYGLYKQATEGNVQGIMPRPEGYTMEDEGAKKKWDAWKREEGLSKTQAKRKYIQFLIDTMRVYANSTAEARELLLELEYLWDQIKDLTYDEYAYNVAPLVALYQSDRMLTTTPWPLQSLYSASRPSELYSQTLRHGRNRSPERQPSLGANLATFGGNLATLGGNLATFGRNPASLGGHPASFGGHAATFGGSSAFPSSVPNLPANPPLDPSSFDEIRGVLGKIVRRLDHPDDATPRRLVHVLRVLGWASVSFAASATAILFLVWCLSRGVRVRRSILKKTVNGKAHLELVVNMVVTDNRWFMRMLGLVNGFVGFV